jgi:hypothetical protein
MADVQAVMSFLTREVVLHDALASSLGQEPGNGSPTDAEIAWKSAKRPW